jgi:hypothetical protein
MGLLFLSARQRRIKRRQNALAAEIIRSTEVRVYEVRPRKDKRGVDLISDALPFWLPMVLEVLNDNFSCT